MENFNPIRVTFGLSCEKHSGRYNPKTFATPSRGRVHAGPIWDHVKLFRSDIFQTYRLPLSRILRCAEKSTTRPQRPPLPSKRHWPYTFTRVRVRTGRMDGLWIYVTTWAGCVHTYYTLYALRACVGFGWRVVANGFPWRTRARGKSNILTSLINPLPPSIWTSVTAHMTVRVRTHTHIRDT